MATRYRPVARAKRTLLVKESLLAEMISVINTKISCIFHSQLIGIFLIVRVFMQLAHHIQTGNGQGTAHLKPVYEGVSRNGRKHEKEEERNFERSHYFE